MTRNSMKYRDIKTFMIMQMMNLTLPAVLFPTGL